MLRIVLKIMFFKIVCLFYICLIIIEVTNAILLTLWQEINVLYCSIKLSYLVQIVDVFVCSATANKLQPQQVSFSMSQLAAQFLSVSCYKRGL